MVHLRNPEQEFHKKRETESQTERTLWLPKGRMDKGIVREFRMDMYTRLYLKWINKDLLCGPGNSAQC